jgi:hypothetical protein
MRLAIFFLGLFGGIAAAAAMPRYGFGDLDADKDGRLTAEEAKHEPPLARNFAFADRDGDGRLDRAEYDEAMTLEAEILEAGAHSVRKLALFGELDADRDGALSRAEAAARPALARSFDAADTDGDRRVDRGEFSEVGLDTLAAGGS